MFLERGFSPDVAESGLLVCLLSLSNLALAVRTGAQLREVRT